MLTFELFESDELEARVRKVFAGCKKLAESRGFTTTTESIKFGPGWVSQLVVEKEANDRKLVVNISLLSSQQFRFSRILYVDGKLIFNSITGNDLDEEFITVDDEQGLISIFEKFLETLKTIDDPLTAKQKARLRRGGLK